MEIKKEDVQIMYEDNHLLVVVKPQNVPSQEDASKDADMLTLMKEYLKEKYSKEGEAYLGLVHRLDRPTGGVMVFAKTSKAAARLSASIRDGEFEKTYLVVVEGVPKEKNARLVHYLVKNEEKNIARVVPESTVGAKRAELSYKLLETVKEPQPLSLLKVNLSTGRGHQIRVQTAAIGTPVCGDRRYGPQKAAVAGGLALWASVLKFPHPVLEKTMVFLSYPPEENFPWSKFDISKYLGIQKTL